jgi:hypothetical protein
VPISSLCSSQSLPPGRYVLIQNAAGQIVPVPLQPAAAPPAPERALSAPPATESQPLNTAAASVMRTAGEKHISPPVRPASVDVSLASGPASHLPERPQIETPGIVFGEVSNKSPAGVPPVENDTDTPPTESLLPKTSCDNNLSTRESPILPAAAEAQPAPVAILPAPPVVAAAAASPLKNLVIKQLVKPSSSSSKPNTANKGNKMMLKSYGVPLLPKPPSMMMVVGGGQGGGGGSSSSPSSSSLCNMKAMVACQSCGAYCHHECISANRLCFTCLIR